MCKYANVQLAARTENAAGQLAHFAYQPFAH